MKKIIRTNNLQKALEDYDALKGQAVSYVSVLPVSPDIRNSVYCKQTTTDVEDSLNITVESLIQDYAEETETADHYVIPVTYTVEYLGIAVRAIEVSGDVAIMYEDEDFTTALAASFNLEDKYTFAVTTHVTEMAYYMGDAVNQVLHPVVSFGVIAEVNKRIDVVERELDDKADVSVIVQLDNKIDNSYNTLDNKIDNSYNTLDNKIDNSYNTLDNKIDNSYNTLDNKIDNEISNLAVNFTTNNIVANVATINNASIDTAQVNNFDVTTLIANGSAGSDGQVLGKVNGNVEWFSPSLDTNDFKVNYLTVNNSSVTDNATINNLVVNNATLPRTVTTDVSYNANEPFYELDLKESAGFGEPGITSTDYNFQFLPFIIMPEDEYNKSTFDKGNETYSSYFGTAYRNVISDQVLAFVATAPFGNIYFAGKKIADANCDVKVEELELGNIRLNTTASTASLAFTNDSVTNNFSFDVNVDVSSILGSDAFGNSRANLPYGIDVNNANGVITTNVKNTSFTTFERLFENSSSMTDCFITNPSLILNAPSGYNVWNNVTSVFSTFRGCSNLNQPVTIPDSVTNMTFTFLYCYSLNQPISIPNSVTDMVSTFEACHNFNQPVVIPNSVTNMTNTFQDCSNFNQSIIIPNSVTTLAHTFKNCRNFNQPVVIQNGVTEMNETFCGCLSFNQPVTIPDSVTKLYQTFIRYPGTTEISMFNSPVTIGNGVTNMVSTFYSCSSFNQPVTIPDSVEYMSDVFNNCISFNSPITIGNNVRGLTSTFRNCSNFNQSITIPSSVTILTNTFRGCTKLASSSVPIHISHEIALGDTSNYIYNSLVNGWCGINLAPSRILNDA